MSSAATGAGIARAPSRRAVYMTYASGLLTDSQSELISFIIPLWAVALGLGPLELGILVSARSVLSSVLAIHGGVLMDRYGTRLVMLLMATGSALMPPLMPFATWFPALLALQMAIGLVTSFGWIGAQALVVRVGRNDNAIVGRFSFFARVGVMLAPVIAGAMWDYLPHWLSFLIVGAVGVLFWVAVKGIPAAEVGEAEPRQGAERPPFRLRDILPSLTDYIGAVGLLVIPVVAFVVIVSGVRIASASMQSSFYILYLKEIGLQATIIGLFITLSQFMAASGALSAGAFTRVIHPNWVYLGAVSSSIFFVFSTPIYGNALALLAGAIAIRGFSQGLSQPVMYTILSRAVGKEAQATAIGLRATANRLSNLVVPVIMGAIAELWGLHATFFVTGIGLLAICAGIGVWVAASGHGRGA